MAKSVLSHYSPVLANKLWSQESGYSCYFRDIHSGELESERKGLRQWGRKRGIYSLDVEKSLNEKIETPVASVYEKIMKFESLSESERLLWAQFLMSQIVRTPTFMRYENYLMAELGVTALPDNDRVGCLECMDLALITHRNWKYIISHEDDYFIRTDNPIYITGFLDRPMTCLYYPLHPRICFIACSMEDTWDPYNEEVKFTKNMTGRELEKGLAWQLNYYMVKSCDNSLIVRDVDSEKNVESMFERLVATYPQPPFTLVDFNDQEDVAKFDYIRRLMSECDQFEYPIWSAKKMEPYV